MRNIKKIKLMTMALLIISSVTTNTYADWGACYIKYSPMNGEGQAKLKCYANYSEKGCSDIRWKLAGQNPNYYFEIVTWARRMPCTAGS